ncbi:MAG: hypothetical protein OEU26_27165 [Candidatus Tectomicrobia bacterium]|nr:hypothetical protein [Candidatus Tectomicrobia bacterium]
MSLNFPDGGAPLGPDLGIRPILYSGCWFWRAFRLDQALIIISDGLWIGVEQLALQDLKLRIVYMKLELQGLIGQAALALQHGYGLIE